MRSPRSDTPASSLIPPIPLTTIYFSPHTSPPAPDAPIHHTQLRVAISLHSTDLSFEGSLTACADSGAPVNILDDRWLPPGTRIHPLPAGIPRFEGHGKETLDVYGTAHLTLHFDSDVTRQPFTFRAFVGRKLGQGLLLGTEFFSPRYGAIHLYPGEAALSFPRMSPPLTIPAYATVDPPPRTHTRDSIRLYTISAHSIPANSILHISVRPPGHSPLRVASTGLVDSPHRRHDEDDPQVFAALATPTSPTSLTIPLINILPYDIDIPRNLHVANFISVDPAAAILLCEDGNNFDSPPPEVLLKIIDHAPRSRIAALLASAETLPSVPHVTVQLTTPPSDAPWLRDPPPDTTLLTPGDVNEAIPKLNLSAAHARLTPPQFHRLAKLLLHYQAQFQMENADLGNTPFPPVPINLTTDLPVAARRHHTSAAENEKATKMVEGFATAGIVRSSFSAFSAPVMIVPKPDGTWRFAIDYRALNEHVEADPYPLPRIDDTLDKLRDHPWFSSLDLLHGFWNIRVLEEHKHKLAFTTAGGHWEWNVLPMGYKNSPAIFQRCMDLLLAGLKWWCALVYLDDIIIFSTSFDEHLHHLSLVFQRIADYRLAIKPSKCDICAPSLPYLGHLVTPTGIRPDPKKVRGILNMAPPATRAELEVFYGAIGYHRAFIKRFAERTEILNSLKSVKKPWTANTWTEAHQTAFDDVRNALANATERATFDPSLPTIVETDASYTGISAILLQKHPEHPHPRLVVCLSRKLTPQEKRYSAPEIECLALWWALKKKLRSYLHLLPFDVITDHRALLWLSKSTDISSRLFRWWTDLRDFQMTISHRPGRLHFLADYLSRHPDAEATPDTQSDAQPDDEGFPWPLRDTSLPCSSITLRIISATDLTRSTNIPSSTPPPPTRGSYGEGSMDDRRVAGAAGGGHYGLISTGNGHRPARLPTSSS